MAAPCERRASRPKRSVLYASRQTLTDSVPQTLEGVKQMHRRLQQSPSVEERWDMAEPRFRHDAMHAHASRTDSWPSSSRHDHSGCVVLPAPMELLLSPDASMPPFMTGMDNQLVTAPNTANGRSCSAQLGHRLTQFKRTSQDKYERLTSTASVDSLWHEPRAARQAKPKLEQSGWHYVVQEDSAVSESRTAHRLSTHPTRVQPKRALSPTKKCRPHTSNNLFTHTASTCNSGASSRLSSCTPDGTTSLRPFRLGSADLSSSCSRQCLAQPSSDKTGILAKSKLVVLHGLRPGSRHHVTDFVPWSGLSPNPFCREFPSARVKLKDEQRPETPEWTGAYHRTVHDAAVCYVKDTAKAFAAKAPKTTVREAKAWISTQRQLTPALIT